MCTGSVELAMSGNWSILSRPGGLGNDRAIEWLIGLAVAVVIAPSDLEPGSIVKSVNDIVFAAHAEADKVTTASEIQARQNACYEAGAIDVWQSVALEIGREGHDSPSEAVLDREGDPRVADWLRRYYRHLCDEGIVGIKDVVGVDVGRPQREVSNNR